MLQAESCHILVQKPKRDTWGSGLEAMTTYLDLEKSVNQSLLDLQKLSAKNNDVQVTMVTVTPLQWQFDGFYYFPIVIALHLS